MHPACSVHGFAYEDFPRKGSEKIWRQHLDCRGGHSILGYLCPGAAAVAKKPSTCNQSAAIHLETIRFETQHGIALRIRVNVDRHKVLGAS